jgi:SAM-dependent methyltransferase
MEQLLETVPFRAGERIMDVGSNTCWASALLAGRGLEVVALDIAKTQMQGLRTAEWWFEGRGVYFERVLGTMFNPPLRSGSLDYVLCCEVLHHNDSRTLPVTMKELHRVLRPGGKLLVMNETMKFPLDMKRDHAREVAEYEGYEHTFFFHQYWLAAKRAGFDVTVLEPAYHHFFRGDVYGVGPETSAVDTLKIAAVHLARGHRIGRKLYLAWRNLIAGEVALSMVCEKPARSQEG